MRSGVVTDEPHLRGIGRAERVRRRAERHLVGERRGNCVRGTDGGIVRAALTDEHDDEAGPAHDVRIQRGLRLGQRRRSFVRCAGDRVDDGERGQRLAQCAQPPPADMRSVCSSTLGARRRRPVGSRSPQPSGSNRNGTPTPMRRRSRRTAAATNTPLPPMAAGETTTFDDRVDIQRCQRSLDQIVEEPAELRHRRRPPTRRAVAQASARRGFERWRRSRRSTPPPHATSTSIRAPAQPRSVAVPTAPRVRVAIRVRTRVWLAVVGVDVVPQRLRRRDLPGPGARLSDRNR